MSVTRSIRLIFKLVMSMRDKWLTGCKLTGTDLIQLFISKSFWHSHYKPLFLKVSNHPDMAKWLEGHEDKPSDEVLWGYKRGTYQFKDLKYYLEENEKKKKKGKGKEKDEKLEGCHVTFSPCLTPVFCYSDQSRPLPLSSANSRSRP